MKFKQSDDEKKEWIKFFRDLLKFPDFFFDKKIILIIICNFGLLFDLLYGLNFIIKIQGSGMIKNKKMKIMEFFINSAKFHLFSLIEN